MRRQWWWAALIAIVMVSAIILALPDETPATPSTLSEPTQLAAPTVTARHPREAGDKPTTTAADASVASRPVPPGPTGRINLFVHIDQVPIADAGINIWSFGNDGVDVTTDSEGRASVDVPEGDWMFRVDAEEYELGLNRPAVHVTAGPDAVDVELELVRIVWIEGVVVDENDAPVADASINYERRTDSRGNFRVGLSS